MGIAKDLSPLPRDPKDIAVITRDPVGLAVDLKNSISKLEFLE